MSKETDVLAELVADATALLHQTEMKLSELAQAAFIHRETFESGPSSHTATNGAETAVRMQQIGEQLTRLSQRSQALQKYLENGAGEPPFNEEHWPRIKILQSHEEERTQLARELEDGVGQLLANAVFELASCRHLLTDNSPAVSDGLDALQQELEQGLTDIRQLITDLEPAAILSNFGLAGGMRRYLEQFEKRSGLATELLIHINPGRLPSTIEIAIFRIIQEALQNVQRHANAGRVAIIFEETAAGMLEFGVVDDGVGIASDKIDISRKNFGLARMVDYADLIGSKLRIFSEPEQGTKVVLSVPYHML